ncbi:hypothetical protein NDU88_005560 [Pleurodeles waltl]|uniref:Uncharacterized protein n=1 Tax=Pleurodeles waltl TaxID=8319 RepID=A0AAV7N4S0_PLEWA|nr:hypothetical protein NDU88_005560 [Pleurodeles waltl]
MAPPASAAAPPFQAGHGGTPLGLPSHHQGGEAQQPRRVPPGSRAPQINHVVPSQAQSGSTASRGPAARQDLRGPPQPAPLLTSRRWGRRESLSQPHSSLAAARRLQARRSTSGPAERRQGSRHFTDSPGSKHLDSRTGRGPIRSQMPLVRGSAYSTPESGEIKNLSP